MAEYKKSRKHRYDGKSMKYLPLTLVLFVVALIIGLCGFFRVSDIVVTGAEMYSEDEIIKASGVEKGDNLLLFSSSSVKKEINSKLAYAGEVTVEVKYPSTVMIQLNESKAIASISAGGYYWIIDTNGKILEQTDNNGAADTILITGIELTQPAIGNNINADNSTKTTYLIELLRTIYENDAADKVTELDITSIANITFDYDGRFTVKYGDGGDGGAKFEKMVEVVNSQLKSHIKGTIEFDAEGGVHVIPN